MVSSGGDSWVDFACLMFWWKIISVVVRNGHVLLSDAVLMVIDVMMICAPPQET